MSFSTRMCHAIAATLLVTAILVAFPLSAASAKTNPAAPAYRYVSQTLCPIRWQEGPYHVKRLIRCAAHHYGISVDKALAIARRESRYHPRAYNSSSCAKGIYQHLCRYWRGRAFAYGFAGYSAFNARANIIVTFRMVRRLGWEPWGG